MADVLDRFNDCLPDHFSDGAQIAAFIQSLIYFGIFCWLIARYRQKLMHLNLYLIVIWLLHAILRLCMALRHFLGKKEYNYWFEKIQWYVFGVSYLFFITFLLRLRKFIIFIRAV